MMWEGFVALPFVLETKVVILEHDEEGIRERSLTLFAARARRAMKLRGEVNIRITSSREMRELNRRFRMKNAATDVLSFPSSIPKLAGDIAISAEIAAANAAALGHSTETELKVLILHGMLHLAGYDHEADEGQMQFLEAKLRRQFMLPAAVIERAHGAAASLRKSRQPAKRNSLVGRRR